MGNYHLRLPYILRCLAGHCLSKSPKYTQDKTYAFTYFSAQHPAPNSVTLAVDVGCGTGSSTRPLAEHFQHVVGVDVSETQLEEARKYPGTQENIQYK